MLHNSSLRPSCGHQHAWEYGCLWMNSGRLMRKGEWFHIYKHQEDSLTSEDARSCTGRWNTSVVELGMAKALKSCAR